MRAKESRRVVLVVEVEERGVEVISFSDPRRLTVYEPETVIIPLE
jgi:hypothetical protein